MGDDCIIGKEAFLDNLRYDFRYNGNENTIDITYWFSSAIPDEAASIIDFVPHAHTIRYHPPKHRGRKPALDALFDDPREMLRVTKKAEAEFERGLGDTINTAIQLFIHLTMYRCGAMAWKETSKKIADLFAKAFRTDIAERLKIKRGPSPLFKDADHYCRALLECMKSDLTEGKIASARQFTQEKLAERLAKKFKDEAKIDARTIRQWNKGYGLRWLEFRNESWRKLTAEN